METKFTDSATSYNFIFHALFKTPLSKSLRKCNIPLWRRNPVLWPLHDYNVSSPIQNKMNENIDLKEAIKRKGKCSWIDIISAIVQINKYLKLADTHEKVQQLHYEKLTI